MSISGCWMAPEPSLRSWPWTVRHMTRRCLFWSSRSWWSLRIRIRRKNSRSGLVRPESGESKPFGRKGECPMTLKEATEKGRSITLDDLRSIDREFITPVIAANILGCDPHYIRLTAREAPEELGYNATRIGRNIKIPRIGFIRFLEGGAGNEDRV
nr:MAG TPA: hypothetical protein [Caudoviricetes sp.]